MIVERDTPIYFVGCFITDGRSCKKWFNVIGTNKLLKTDGEEDIVDQPCDRVYGFLNLEEAEKMLYSCQSFGNIRIIKMYIPEGATLVSNSPSHIVRKRKKLDYD